MSGTISTQPVGRLFAHPAITPIIGLLLFLSLFQFQVEIVSLTITPSSILIWVLLVWGMGQIIYQKGEFRLARIPFLRLWVLYVCLTLIGFAYGEGNLSGPLQAVWSLFRSIEILLLYPIVAQIATGASTRRWIVIAISLGICVSAFFGIGQSLSNGRWFSGLSENGNGRYLGLFMKEELNFRARFAVSEWNKNAPFFRAHGTASSPNLFAALMNVGLALAAGMLMAGTRQRSWWIGVVILTSAGLFLSLSRAGWAAIVTAVIMVGIVKARLRWSHIRTSVLTPIATVVAIAVAAQFAPEAIQQRLTSILSPQATSEVQSRQEVWNIAWQRILERPLLGYGTDRIPGTLLQSWGIFPPDVSPHNIYLTAAYQYGIVFALVTIIWLIVILYTGYQLANSTQPFARGLGMGTMILALAIMIHGFFDSILQPPMMQILLWSLLGTTATTLTVLRGASPIGQVHTPSGQMPAQLATQDNRG